MKNSTRDFLIALSLANLLFLRAWQRSQPENYLDDFKPDGLSIAFCVLTIAILLWVGWRLIRSSPRWSAVGKTVFLISLLLPLNALRLYYKQSLLPLYGRKYDWVAWTALAILALPIVLAAATRHLRPRFLVRYGILLVLLLTPFTLFTFGGVGLDTYRAAATKSQPAATASGVRVNFKRVVWIIFDELDEHLAFQERPASLSLPEFDRLRQTSLVASAARPPAGETIESIPALLNGSMISRVAPRGDSLLLWNQDEEQPVVWSPQMTLFADTSAAGMKSGLAGVYHPYCRILAGSLSDCRDFRTFRARESFTRRIARAIVVALDAVPLAYRSWLRGVNLRYEIEQYESAIHEASSLAADPTFQLVYIHLPVPHPPARYDRNSGHLDPSPTHSYLDSLKLADVSLGVLRQSMEQSGVWAESTVILSSDHWWRSNLWRDSMYWTNEDQRTAGGRAPEHLVPFMVKLSGASDALQYGRPFNTVITRKMISAIQKGKFAGHEELARWLDANAIGPVEPMLTPAVIASADH